MIQLRKASWHSIHPCVDLLIGCLRRARENATTAEALHTYAEVSMDGLATDDADSGR